MWSKYFMVGTVEAFLRWQSKVWSPGLSCSHTLISVQFNQLIRAVNGGICAHLGAQWARVLTRKPSCPWNVFLAWWSFSSVNWWENSRSNRSNNFSILRCNNRAERHPVTLTLLTAFEKSQPLHAHSVFCAAWWAPVTQLLRGPKWKYQWTKAQCFQVNNLA